MKYLENNCKFNFIKKHLKASPLVLMVEQNKKKCEKERKKGM